jgi:hypothetical protein
LGQQVVRNALENDALLVLAAALGGGLAYYVLEPYFPEFTAEVQAEEEEGGAQGQGGAAGHGVTGGKVCCCNCIEG